MRNFSVIATVIVLVANAAWVEQTSAQWHDATTRDPRFSVEFGIKAYDRPGNEDSGAAITDFGTTVLTNDQVTDLGNAAGAEVSFNFVSDHGREFELRSVIAEWDTALDIAGAGLGSPFFTDIAAPPTAVDFDYESDYFSIELMSRRAIRPGVTFMFGPRFVSASEQVTVNSSAVVDTGVGTAPVVFTDDRTFDASNNLIGLQAGFEFNFPITQYVHINSFIRAGGYVNPTELNTSAQDSLTATITSVRRTDTIESFLGEVGGRLQVDIIPNAMSSYIGYEATWIDGFAQAPPALVGLPPAGVETTNTVFFNALTFGLNFNY